MDFELPEELKLLKDNVRRFVDRELIPLEREVVNDVKLQKELPARLRDKADALGLWHFDVPEEFGGLGLGMMAKVIVWSEVSRTTALPGDTDTVKDPAIRRRCGDWARRRRPGCRQAARLVSSLPYQVACPVACRHGLAPSRTPRSSLGSFVGLRVVTGTSSMRVVCLFLSLLISAWLLSPSARATDYQSWEVLNWGEGAADTLDPHATRSTTDVTGKINLYDGLYRYDGVDLVPSLATGHTVSDDGLTWTFTLRQGAKFHSGNEVTADDVVYSVRRLLGLKQAPSAPFWPILKPDNVVAAGRYSVKMTLDKPYAPFLAAIPLIGIVDKALVESHAANGDWAATWVAANDAGSGPYRTEPGTFRPSQVLTLAWFPDYFAPWGPKPIKQVNISTTREPTTLALALLKGELDSTDTRIAADTIDRIRKGKNVTVAGEQSMRTFVLTMDNARPPFDNIHVRKAISYGFDYDGFIGTLREGTVARNVGPIPQNLWGNPKDLVGYRHDVNKAKEEIALARKDGVDLGRTLVVYGFTNTRDTYLASQLLQSNLRQIGLKVDIKDTFFPNLASMAANRDTAPDMWFHWVSAFFIDPSNWIGEMYDSQFQGAWKASAFYNNSKVDALLREALAVPDQDKRRDLYEDASRLVVADAPALWIYNAIEYRGLSNRVQGYRFSPVGGGAYFRVMSLSE